MVTGNPGSTRCLPPLYGLGCRSLCGGSKVSNEAPDGRVSSYLHDHVKLGDLLDVSALPATFVLTPTDVAARLLASAGAGITTVLPIVEQIARTQPAAERDRGPR